MLTHEERYKTWILDYVGAWRQRMIDNGGIIPTNIGLDGKIGGACGGKWYGGIYGWGFSVVNPATGQVAHRNYHPVAINGFGNAFLLTGDDRFLDVWRRQIDAVNAQAKVENGRTLYPHMYGETGWYDYRPEPYRAGVLELYYWSMKEADRRRVPNSDWLAFLEGRNPSYPETALRGDFATIRRKVEAMRRDPTTPDTRLADDPMAYNPATVGNLVHLMLGGLPPKHQGEVLQARVRYFDPIRRRPGLPEDVAALVDSLRDDSDFPGPGQSQPDRAADPDRAGRRLRRKPLRARHGGRADDRRLASDIPRGTGPRRGRPADHRDEAVRHTADPRTALAARLIIARFAVNPLRRVYTGSSSNHSIAGENRHASLPDRGHLRADRGRSRPRPIAAHRQLAAQWVTTPVACDIPGSTRSTRRT